MGRWVGILFYFIYLFVSNRTIQLHILAVSTIFVFKGQKKNNLKLLRTCENLHFWAIFIPIISYWFAKVSMFKKIWRKKDYSRGWG